MSPSFPSPQRRRDAAYTLFEIMLVLGIIAVLVGSAIFLLGNQVNIAKVQRVDTDAQAIDVALKSYEMLNYTMPTTAQGLIALTKRPTVEPVPKRWTQFMTEVPRDPWGEPYEYANPGKKNATGYDIYSKGPDKTAGNEDDVWPSK
jgi:general secretion pathway protein G